MDLIWVISGGILILAGIVGSVLPFLPGPPLCFFGLLLQQLRDDAPYSVKFLWIWAAITLFVVALDYIVPLYGTKKYGGTKYGMWGCAVGLIAGIWLGPFGIIIGPFIGALAGELIGNAGSDHALKAALGSFLGFLLGTLVKLVACSVMGYYYIASLI